MISESLLRKEYIESKKPMWLIAKENSIAVGTVYNYLKAFGIQRRKRMSEETKQKISIAKTGKPSTLKGTKKSDDTREKMSVAKKGNVKTFSEYGGHEKKHARGYTYVFVPDHPFATREGYVFKHILAYEKYHSCIVDRTKYCVHHIDENKENNAKDNLLLMTKSEHMSYHARNRKRGNKRI